MGMKKRNGGKVHCSSFERLTIIDSLRIEIVIE